ncbi:MAG: tetratricopeptide repeat protein [Pyrinomonadaceae bacterium]|nr:tetratricopeptide repeat protein [Pyrinomonadaceae bacterium]
MSKFSFYSIITIVLLAFWATSCASTENAAPRKPTLPTAKTVAQADDLGKGHNDLPKLREAVNLLAQIRNPDARNFEVEWKFAKYNYFLGRLTTDEKEGKKAFENGETAGQITSRIEPNKPDGYFWYGANLGEQAKRAPLTKGLTSIGDIRTAMNKVIAIEPAYQGASAFDALAQIELSTRLTGGKSAKAVEYLEKAIEIDRENSYTRLHLAQAYLAANRAAEAKKQLDYLLKMKPNPEYLPEYAECVSAAKKLLETKF